MNNYYAPELQAYCYFTPSVIPSGESWATGEKLNQNILADFYAAIEWYLAKGYEEYTELASNTINPGQQNAFTPLRVYRVKRNGHYREAAIYCRMFGGCVIEERSH